MIIDCQSCGATYNIAEDKVRGRRVRVRCKGCGSAIIVDGLALGADDATRQVPASYVKEHEEEATRVMSAPMRPEWREPAALPRPPSAPPPAAIEWTVNFEGSEQRPMSLEDIVEAYQSGLVTRDAYAWREGLPGWVPIFEVPEIRSALESAEPTRVVGVSELRRARAVSAERTPAVPMPPLRSAPLPYVPPAPALSTRDLPSDVEYSPPAPLPRSARPQPPPAARVTTPRGGPDLFDRAELAGSERELLASQSEPAPSDSLLTGARRDSSILFSLDALKGARRPGASGVPPRPAAGPRTAPDILGLSAGSSIGVMSADPALLTAPAAEPPPPSSYPAVAERARMDTTPPVARRSGKFLYVLGGALVAALVMAGSVTVFEKLRASPVVNAAPAPKPASKAPASLPAPQTPVAATSVVSAVPALQAAPAPETTAPVPVPTEPPKTVPAAAAQKPSAALVPAAKSLAVAQSPAPAVASPKATAAAATATSNVAVPKVVLEEEQSGGAAAPTAAAVPPAEPQGPAFDTAAAKAALTSAAAAASACKEPGGPTGSGKVQVTFATSGRATSANIISGPFAGTTVGGCVARAFRQAQVPPFSGNSVTVAKGFTISE